MRLRRGKRECIRDRHVARRLCLSEADACEKELQAKLLAVVCPAQLVRSDQLCLHRHLAPLATTAHGQVVKVGHHATTPSVAEGARREADGHRLDPPVRAKRGAFEEPACTPPVANPVNVERLMLGAAAEVDHLSWQAGVHDWSGPAIELGRPDRPNPESEGVANKRLQRGIHLVTRRAGEQRGCSWIDFTRSFCLAGDRCGIQADFHVVGSLLALSRAGKLG